MATELNKNMTKRKAMGQLFSLRSWENELTNHGTKNDTRNMRLVLDGDKFYSR